MFKISAIYTSERYRSVFAIFLFTGMTYDIFCCFGTTGNAKKQLKISDIGITKEEIAC